MKSITLYFVLLVSAGLQAQSLGLQQLGSIGGELRFEDHPSLVHSIGAVASTVIENGIVRLDQGMFLACDLYCKDGKNDPDPTGIESMLYDPPRIHPYPNPVKDILFLQGEVTLVHHFDLFSLRGQKVASSLVKNARIELKNHPSGLYLLRIYDQKGKLMYSGKITKN